VIQQVSDEAGGARAHLHVDAAFGPQKVALDGGDQPDAAARAPSLAAEVSVLADRVVYDGDMVR